MRLLGKKKQIKANFKKIKIIKTNKNKEIKIKKKKFKSKN